MMAPVSSPPGLSLPEPLSEDSIIEQESVAEIRAPPGLSLPMDGSVAPPPGLMQIPEDSEASAPEIRRSVFSIAAHLDTEEDDVVVPRHIPCPAPAAGVGSYRELQKTMFEKEKLEKKMKKLQAMVACVEEMRAIQQSVKSIDESYATKESAKPVQQEAARARPSSWSKKESSKHPGKFYYVNSETGKTTWTKPEDFEIAKETSPVKAATGKFASGMSDYDGSTDAGSSSDDAGDFARSVSSRASSQRTAASMTLKADAPTAFHCSKVMKSVARTLAQAGTMADFEIDQACLASAAMAAAAKR